MGREKVGGLRDRLLGIERIRETALHGGPGHELSHALRAGRAHDAHAKAAFLQISRVRNEAAAHGSG